MDGACVVGQILLNRYRVERVLAQDRMEVVLEVTDVASGAVLAIKLLSAEAFAAPGVTARLLGTQRMSRARRVCARGEPAAPRLATATLRASASDRRVARRRVATIAAAMVATIAVVSSMVGAARVRHTREAHEPALRASPPVVVAPSPEPEPSAALQAPIAACVEMRTLRRWPDLARCAEALERQGQHDPARELARVAAFESRNEAELGHLAEALRQDDLRAAIRLLDHFDKASVYRVAAEELFHFVDGAEWFKAERQVHVLIETHQCVALHRYLQEMTVRYPTYDVNALKMLACAPAPGVPSHWTGEVPAAQLSCAALDVDDVLTQATMQYTIGYAKDALALVTRVLACEQDLRLYRLAAMYACAAGEHAAAQRYLAKIPESFQVGIAARCAQASRNPGY